MYIYMKIVTDLKNTLTVSEFLSENAILKLALMSPGMVGAKMISRRTEEKGPISPLIV